MITVPFVDLRCGKHLHGGSRKAGNVRPGAVHGRPKVFCPAFCLVSTQFLKLVWLSVLVGTAVSIAKAAKVHDVGDGASSFTG